MYVTFLNLVIVFSLVKIDIVVCAVAWETVYDCWNLYSILTYTTLTV